MRAQQRWANPPVLRVVRRDPARSADVFVPPIDPAAPKLPSDVLETCKRTGRVVTRAELEQRLGKEWREAFDPDPPSSPTPLSVVAPPSVRVTRPRTTLRAADDPPSSTEATVNAALEPLEPMPPSDDERVLTSELITDDGPETVQAPWQRLIPPPLPKPEGQGSP